MSTDVERMRRLRESHVDAKRRKARALARLRGEETGLVPVAPIRARAAQLVDLGWSYEAILKAANCEGTSAGLRLIAHGTSRQAERKWLPIAALPYSLHIPASVPDVCIVPSLGATRRVRALMAQGWRHEDITEYIGRVSHHLAAGRHPRMNAHDWRLVDLAYDLLSSGQGGSAKSKTRARKAGYVPALAWNNIDDPTETPRLFVERADDSSDPIVIDRVLAGDEAIAKTATRAERTEIVARWRESGRPINELERMTGWQARRYRTEGAA